MTRVTSIRTGLVRHTAFLRTRPALWCAFSGVLYSLTFFNGWLFPCGFLGLILFFLCLFGREAGETVQKPFRKAFFFFLGFYIPLYSWFTVLYPFEAFSFTATEGILVVCAAVFGISLLHSTEAGICFLLAHCFRRRSWMPVGCGCVFMLLEWVMSLGTLGFSWGTVGVGQYRNLLLLQNASLLGSYGITFLVAVCCAYAALWLTDGGKGLLSLAAGFLIVPILTGTLLYALPTQSGKTYRAALVQGNILSMEKWDDEKRQAILKTYLTLTEEAAAAGNELIVIPESAFASVYRAGDPVDTALKEIVRTYHCTLIFGALTMEDGEEYNSILLMAPDGSLSVAYHKRHLVPFGEYLPWGDTLLKLFPFLSDLNLDSGNYTAGTSSNLFTLEDGTKVGGLVCFDSIFMSLARESVADGAELLAVCTNDSWYEDSAGVYQHMAHSVLRAVENGRWVMRAANTGVSCFISPKGNITQETQPMIACSAFETVSTVNGETIYTKLGDVILYLGMAYLVLTVCFAISRKMKAKRGLSCLN